MPTTTRPGTVRHAVDRVSRFLDLVQRVLVTSIVVILSASALLLLWQVFDRLVLGQGQNWIEEYARLSLVWMTFLGAAALLREHRHLTVEYVVDKFPAPLRRWFGLAVDAAVLALLTVLLLQIPAVWASSSVLVSPSLGIPRTTLALAAFISYGIGAAYCLESIVRRVLDMDPVRRIATDDATETSGI
ncbi:TRAP transporter small permease [Jiangella asiatica]|uniref:TRAP transporter small permease n=1 Tax=Jiangella asiatica TaxID=2530372 RepID=A0A4R5DNH2_9ACTN|nr:TRAP transporter small permease [Jiangella asiatica]TDE15876.1 TRAP transporter small permease [Jiangella asiatica]